MIGLIEVSLMQGACLSPESSLVIAASVESLYVKEGRVGNGRFRNEVFSWIAIASSVEVLIPHISAT